MTTSPLAEPGPDLSGHSLDARCRQCPGEHGGPGPCDHQRYGRRWLRFARRHREGLGWGAMAGQGRAGANELRRLEREFATLPPRHDCSCRCPREEAGFGPCPECVRIRAHMRAWQIPEETGGGHHRAHAPMPTPVLLDLATGWAYR